MLGLLRSTRLAPPGAQEMDVASFHGRTHLFPPQEIHPPVILTFTGLDTHDTCRNLLPIAHMRVLITATGALFNPPGCLCKGCIGFNAKQLCQGSAFETMWLQQILVQIVLMGAEWHADFDVPKNRIDPTGMQWSAHLHAKSSTIHPL